MDIFLSWFAEHNKTVIQVTAVLIGLILVYFVYRLLFGKKEALFSVVSETSPDEQVGQSSLDKSVDDAAHISEQKTDLKPVDSYDTSDLEKMLEAKDEEILLLKSKLSQGFDKAESLANTNLTEKTVGTEDQKNEADVVLIAKVEELERKIKEYEIIAEDIAELQNLRKENEDLQNQLKLQNNANGESRSS